MSPSSTRFKSPIKDRSIDWQLTVPPTVFDDSLSLPIKWTCLDLGFDYITRKAREVNRSAAVSLSNRSILLSRSSGKEQRIKSSLSVGPVILIDDFSAVRRETRWFIPLETPSSPRNGQFTFIWFPSPQRSSNWCYYTTSTPRIDRDWKMDQWHRTCYQIPFWW